MQYRELREVSGVLSLLRHAQYKNCLESLQLINTKQDLFVFFDVII